MIPENWKSNDIEINGGNLHYTRTGLGTKPSLILLHGITDFGLNWTRVAKELEKDFDIIMPDAPGHGQSSILDDRLDQSYVVENIAELIKRLDLSKPVIIGHSMGGITATLLAANHPDLISKIILEDPPYLLGKKPLFRLILFGLLFKFMIKRNMKKSVTDIEKMCRKMNPTWHESEVIPWAQAQKAFAKKESLDMLKKMGKSKVDWHEVFPKIIVPSLLIVPGKGMMNIETAKEIIQEFVHGKLAYIEKAGHNVRREDYPSFMNAVKTFII
ncbi:MAG: alpha/beta fold hydrolase [Promethearchaeota archaeon]